MTVKIEKLIRNGCVAVLYSPGFGAGWSTWASEDAEALLFDPQIADLVDQGAVGWQEQAESIANIKYPDQYLGGLQDLQVAWIPQGAEFLVREYDGSESIELKEKVAWWTA